MNEIENIFFVSEIRSMNSKANSTHIMTLSLLQGLKKNGTHITFFAICEYPDEVEAVKKEYSQVADVVIPLSSNFKEGLNKFHQLGLMLKYSWLIGYYRKETEKICSQITTSPDLIISHTPSFEGICYSRVLKEKYPEIPYFQYWSDPVALSGITPDMLSVKRLPFRKIEAKALGYADKIIYGTRTLMLFQQKLYSSMAEKMAYIDIPYLHKPGGSVSLKKRTILYAGNYYSNLRNINPLIQAVESMNGYRLDIYGDGDCSIQELHNTRIHERISAAELKKIETDYEYLVCVLNHSCIQIPGKIFYDMSRPVKIIVIADGKYQKNICDYLSEFHRFLICENTSENIAQKIIASENTEIDLSFILEKYSPEKITRDLLHGGKI